MNAPGAIETQTFGRKGSSRPLGQAMKRGSRKKCPACGVGAIFSGYTRTRDRCPHCGLDLSGYRADDAPPYLTVLIVGHLCIPLALAAKQVFDPPLGWQFAFWAPVMVLAMVWLLPVSKGAMIGLQWANRMHGFGEPAAPAQEADPAVLDSRPGVV